MEIQNNIYEQFNELTVANFVELVRNNIKFPSELFKNNLELLKSKDVLDYIFRTYDDIPKYIIDVIIENDIDITFDDVKKNESIRKEIKLLNFVYNKDPRVFLLFPREFMLYRVARDAVQKGVYATEEDILFNPILRDMAPIMEASIRNNPKILKYVTLLTGVQLNIEVITEALSKYKLTEEDLINNPELCGVFNIMAQLPEYRLYSTYLTEEDRIVAIEKLLNEKKFMEIEKLPFFKKQFESKASSENIGWLLSFIYKEIDEEDLVDQKRYQKLLDYIVDGIVANMYYDNKYEFVFSDTVAIANELKSTFYKAKENNNEELINDFAKKLNAFVNINKKGKELISYDRLIATLNDLYSKFKEDENSIYNNIATVFYNEILNVHRNSYCSIEKSKILSKIKYILPLREKKKISILNGKKLIHIAYLMATQKYDDLGITRNYLVEKLEKVEREIVSNKDLINSYGIISKEKIDYFNTLFLNSGQLDYLTIAHTLGTSDYEVNHYIFKKYEHIKVELLDRIELSKEDKIINQKQISNIGFNVLNFNIASKDMYLKNIANILLNITDEDINLIKNNQLYMNEILNIIPFIDLVPGFDTGVVIKILRNFGKIKTRIYGVNSINNSDMSLISKFNDVISLANGYDVMNNLYEAILGREIIEKIGIKDSKKYFDFYLKMHNKNKCSIPKVIGEYEDMVYESGNFNDVDRLLIGKKYNYSCVDLTNTAGKETFIECLSENNGDVIMLKDKKTGEFVARALIFRRGNIVQIAKIYSIYGSNFFYPDDFFKNIANQIIDAANKVGDNIDYVFVTNDGIKKTDFKEFDNILFETAFPHADLCKRSYLVAVNPMVKDKDINNNLDFFSEPKSLYSKERSPITTEASETELTRLKALKISMEKDELLKQQLEDNFEPFYRKDYVKTISGEDWYITLKEDGEIEEVVLPSEDPRTMIEFEKARSKILSIKEDYTLNSRK